MTRLIPARWAAPALLLLAASASAADPSKPLDRDAVLARLTANKVSLAGLASSAKNCPPFIGLGAGLNGGDADNGNDENLALVAQLPEVERLMLYKGRFSKAGMAALAGMPNLRYLQVYSSAIDPKAFAVLGEIKKLEALEISEYPVTDEVIGHVASVPGLKLLEINKGGAVTPAVLARCLENFPGMETLLLFGDLVDDGCLKPIGAMKGLKRLWLDSRKVSAPAWSSLKGLDQMRDLYLRGTTLDDEGARALEGMKDLEALYLAQTRITDAAMTALSGLTKLHDLGLEGTRITDRGMANLKELTALSNLYVSETEVTAKGLAAVPRKERMVMMRVGKAALTPKQLDEVMALYPQTQIFDPAGYWTTERIQSAMKELGKEVPKR